MSVQGKSILIVDDDPHIRDVLRYTLEKEGIIISEADNGKTGLEKALAEKPDIIILDILMPEMTGIEVCKTLRKTSEIPIVFLSSMDDELDRILGLELGGDEYITKPFSPRELVARVKIIFKRFSTQSILSADTQTLLQVADVHMNLETYQVYYQDNLVVLTATEFNLLQTFLTHPKKIYTRNELLDADIFKDIVTDRTIDSHIRRLRQKFTQLGCTDIVKTAHGFGYQLGLGD